MADNKKTIGLDVGTSAEATEQPRPAPDLADTAACVFRPNGAAKPPHMVHSHR